MYRALLLDIGDVISAPVWDQFDELETHLGRPIVGRGPLDPAGDEPWRRHVAGEISFVQYWIEFARQNGYGDDWRQVMRDLAYKLPHRFSDPDAITLMNDAKAAGYKVGVLTNDGVLIAGREWLNGRPEFADLDAFVDASENGTPKPHPESYLRSAHALGLETSEIVFLDDTPACVEGANAIGMKGVLVDPINRTPAFNQTRALLSL
jgi:putative hydrolase of the HAD superfamily